MKTLNIAEARQNFSALVDEVRFGGEPVVISKYGRPAVMITTLAVPGGGAKPPPRDWRDELELRHPYRGQSFSMAPDIALASAELPEPFHRDPADRLIVAQARRSRATLVTADRKILAYPHVKTAPWE